MRIAMFTETFLPATDGVVTRLRHTIEELVRMGDELLVFAPSGGPESYAGVRVHGVPGVPFPLYPEKRVCPPHPGVGRALRRFRPDLVHAVNPETSPVIVGSVAFLVKSGRNGPECPCRGPLSENRRPLATA